MHFGCRRHIIHSQKVQGCGKGEQYFECNSHSKLNDINIPMIYGNWGPPNRAHDMVEAIFSFNKEEFCFKILSWWWEHRNTKYMWFYDEGTVMSLCFHVVLLNEAPEGVDAVQQLAHWEPRVLRAIPSSLQVSMHYWSRTAEKAYSGAAIHSRFSEYVKLVVIHVSLGSYLQMDYVFSCHKQQLSQMESRRKG